jgi:hypothetical protein
LLAKAPESPPEKTPDSAPHLPDGEDVTYREAPPKPRATRPRSGAGTRGRTRSSLRSESASKPESASSILKDETQTYHPGFLVRPLTDFYTTVGTAIYPFDRDIGTSFIQNAGACAEALDNAARVDKNFRKFLMSLVGASVWGPVIIAHAPIATQIVMKVMPKGPPNLAAVPSENGQPT